MYENENLTDGGMVEVMGLTNLTPKNSRCLMAENFWALPGHASPENFENWKSEIG